MIAVFFTALVLFDWFVSQKKCSSAREKRMTLVVIAVFFAWNLTAVLVRWWPDPFTIINSFMGWAN